MNKSVIFIGLFIGICLQMTLIRSECPYFDPYNCEEDSQATANVYSCGGRLTEDDYFHNTADRYCQPASSSLTSDSPCASLYNYGSGGVCWPNTVSAGVQLSFYSAQQWNTQTSTVRAVYQSCKNGTRNPFESDVPSSQQERSGSGWACCDTWYNNKVNIDFCDSLSCWCPPPCNNPSKNTQLLPYKNAKGKRAVPNVNYCFTDCTNCMNTYYGSRSNAWCSDPNNYVVSAQDAQFDTNPNDCSCCKLFNVTSQQPSSNPAPSPTSTPSTTRIPPRVSNSPTGIQQTSASNSYSNLPSTTPSAIPTGNETSMGSSSNGGNSTDTDQNKSLNGGAIAGIVIGSIFGFILLIVVIAAVVGAVLFVVVRGRRNAGVSGISAGGGITSTGV